MKKLAKFLLRSILVLFVLVNIVTAFHAYKLTHFYDRGTVTVKPADQKTKWDITRDILFGLNAVKQLNRLPDTAFETVQLYTPDSIMLEGWYFRTQTPAKGTVILFHGHGSSKQSVMHEAAAFRAMGYHTLLVDFRAHGGSGGNTTTIGYYESEDVQLAYHYIKQKGEQHIVLWGISMGAAAIASAMHTYALTPEKIILEMPFASLLEAAAGRIRLMGIPGQPLATLITFWGGVEHGFWAFNMQPAVYAKSIHVPVLLQWGKKDVRVQETETAEIFANLAGPKKLVVYEQSGHQSLCDSEHEKWVENVSAFLQQPY